MKTLKKLIAGFLIFTPAAVFAQIAPVGDNAFNGTILNTLGLTSSNTYPIDLEDGGPRYSGSRVSAQVIYATSTFSAVTFSTSNYKLNSGVISAPNNGFTLGLQVLYSAGSSPAISGLTSGTSYYIIPVNTGAVELAASLVLAQAGTFITLASTTTATNSYTLTPLAWSGTGSYVWQASDDNVNWGTAPATSSVALSSSTSATDTLYDFGFYNFRWLRLSVTVPTAGAIKLNVPVNIKQDGIGRF